MRIPAEIVVPDLHSDALAADVRDRVDWLQQFHSRILGCRVVVKVPHRHRHYGRHFQVRIELTLAGSPPIVVSHEPSLHGSPKALDQPAPAGGSEDDGVDPYARAAVHEAFEIARRRLVDAARQHYGASVAYENRRTATG